jgi:hypothetical protein
MVDLNMASTPSLVILLIHLASLTSCVDSYPTPDPRPKLTQNLPSEAIPYVRARRWQRKPATPLEHKIVFACSEWGASSARTPLTTSLSVGGLLFLGIVAWIYRNFRRAPKPADPDPAASVSWLRRALVGRVAHSDSFAGRAGQGRRRRGRPAASDG